MSYAEPAYSGPRAIQAYRNRHLCYTRICLLIGSIIHGQDMLRRYENSDRPPNPVTFPTKTHLFLVGEFPLLTSYTKPTDDWTGPNWTHSLSASLPSDTLPPGTSSKAATGSLRRARELRKEALSRLPLTSPNMGHVATNMRDLQRWPVANCAETLNAIG